MFKEATALLRGLMLPVGFLVVFGGDSQGRSRADSLYQLAQEAYASGDYAGAEFRALKALHDESEIGQWREAELRELLGFVYVARGQRDLALKEFYQVLKLVPSWQLDPLEISPKIVEVFEEARRAYVEWKLRPPAERLSAADLRLAAAWRSLVLPGWGQFFKGQKVRGTGIAAAQFITLAALAVLQIEVNRQHDSYMEKEGHAAVGAYDDYTRTWRARNIIGYLAVGIYVAAYLDALYALPPSR